MDLEPHLNQELGFDEEPQKYRSKTADRMSYEAEVDVIRGQIGDLEDIRFRLGLSARKISQLLMVDPSAWTRWTKKITQPPPHIFRALQWYLLLNEKNPGFSPQIFLASHWHSAQKNSSHEMTELKNELLQLKEKIQILELAKNTPLEPPSPNHFKNGVLFVVGLLVGGLLIKLLKI